MTKLAVLIPAAGAARRMRGVDKLLEPVDGLPLLKRAIAAGLAAGPVFVTLQPGASARRALVDASRASHLDVPAWAEGMSASLRAGASCAKAIGATGLLVLLADMPEIEHGDVIRFIEAHASAPEVVWRGAAEDGRLGHPVLIPAQLFPAVARLSGDEGARSLFAAPGVDVRPLVLSGHRAILDLDTPEDWSAWRARTGR
jgi:CTP:molybdopterin cytidylyltransferase MocA